MLKKSTTRWIAIILMLALLPFSARVPVAAENAEAKEIEENEAPAEEDQGTEDEAPVKEDEDAEAPSTEDESTEADKEDASEPTKDAAGTEPEGTKPEDAEATLPEDADEAEPEEGETEEMTMPELKNLKWVSEASQADSEEAISEEEWAELLKKLSQNVSAVEEVMWEKLDDIGGFSPLSLYMALMAVRPGLPEDAQKTFDETLNPAGISDEEWAKILKAINTFEPDSKKGVWESHTMAIGDQSLEFHPDYLAGLDAYGMDALQADLKDEASFHDINALVSYYTHELIDPLYSDDEIKEKVKDELTNILINTLYFRDRWKQEFDAADTSDETFYGASGEAQIPMMHGQKETMPYLETDDYIAVKKAYQHSAEMILVMPKNDVSREDFLKFYHEARESQDWETADVTLTMPTWNLSSNITLDQVVGALGIGELLDNNGELRFFSDDATAMEVSSAFQRVELKVKEEGTEAAIATVIELKTMSMPVENPEHEVILDHPFLYSVEDGGLSLVQGLISDLS